MKTFVLVCSILFSHYLVHAQDGFSDPQIVKDFVSGKSTDLNSIELARLFQFLPRGARSSDVAVKIYTGSSMVGYVFAYSHYNTSADPNTVDEIKLDANPHLENAFQEINDKKFKHTRFNIETRTIISAQILSSDLKYIGQNAFEVSIYFNSISQVIDAKIHYKIGGINYRITASPVVTALILFEVLKLQNYGVGHKQMVKQCLNYLK